VIGPDVDVPAPGRRDQRAGHGLDGPRVRQDPSRSPARGHHRQAARARWHPRAVERDLRRRVPRAHGSCSDRVLADVDHPTVAIQGFGNAGAQLASLLADAGWRVVAVSDSSRRVHDPDGLDVAARRAQARHRLAGRRAVGDTARPASAARARGRRARPAALEGAIHADNAATSAPGSSSRSPTGRSPPTRTTGPRRRGHRGGARHPRQRRRGDGQLVRVDRRTVRVTAGGAHAHRDPTWPTVLLRTAAYVHARASERMASGPRPATCEVQRRRPRRRSGDVAGQHLLRLDRRAATNAYVHALDDPVGQVVDVHGCCRLRTPPPRSPWCSSRRDRRSAGRSAGTSCSSQLGLGDEPDRDEQRVAVDVPGLVRGSGSLLVDRGDGDRSTRSCPWISITVVARCRGMSKSSRHWTMLRPSPFAWGRSSNTPTTSTSSSVSRRAMISPMSPDPRMRPDVPGGRRAR
jgi:hypothetical protein